MKITLIKLKMKYSIKIILFLFGVSLSVNAQQDAQYTQYMYNMSLINPAYTTSDESTINMGLIHRNQWVGVNGAPKTSSLWFHSALSNKIEVGLSIVNDNIGDVVKENNIYADFAYKIDFEDSGILSFGLKAGMTLFDVNFDGFNLEDNSDFVHSFENISETFFNVGAGVYYNTDRLYIGFSAPNMVKSVHLSEDNGEYQGVEEIHYYLTGGYVLDLSEQFKLKPAFMAKAVKGAPISLDITANVLFNEKFELGVGYRVNDAFSVMAGFRVTQELRIGYAYDHTTSNLGAYSSGSHEVLILYNLNTLRRGYDKSPRFF